jgi:hypothetical protein
MSDLTRRPLRLLCAFEDRAVEDVVVPVLSRVASEEHRSVEPIVRLTHGCRFGELIRLLKDGAAECDFCVIGADTRQQRPHIKQRAMSHSLRAKVDLHGSVYALPQPSAEGWLQADLASLKHGIEEALGANIRLPQGVGPYPRDEKAAKERLRSLLSRAEVPMLRDGLEYAAFVMARMPFDAHPSLALFVRELRVALQAR